MTYLLIRFFELYRKLGRRDLIKEINSLMTSWKKTTVEWKSKHQLQCTKKRSMNSYRDFRILQISRNKLMMISKVPWTVTCTQSKWRSSWKWIRKHRNKCLLSNMSSTSKSNFRKNWKVISFIDTRNLPRQMESTWLNFQLLYKTVSKYVKSDIKLIVAKIYQKVESGICLEKTYTQ